MERSQARERWPSGLRRTLGKRVYVQAYRGFESHSLRQPIISQHFWSSVSLSDIRLGRCFPRIAPPLKAYAYPHLGDVVVARVGTAEVLAVLEPISKEKPENASRVRG